MDAAEIARVKAVPAYRAIDLSKRCSILAADRDALISALEQARKAFDTADDAVVKLVAQRDQAQKDAKDARALAYEECARLVEPKNGHVGIANRTRRDAAADLRARIEAMLERQP